MSGTYVSNGTPGRVFVQNLVFDNNSITPSSTVGDGTVAITADAGNIVNVNNLNVTRDAANTAVLMTSAVEDDHIVIRSSGNGNIYLGSVNNAVKSTTLSLTGNKLVSDNVDGTVLIDPNGPAGTVNLYNQLFVYGGNVGIGISTPNTKLHVVGNIKLTGTLLDTNGDPYIVPTWSKSGNDLYYTAGNAIIGSSSAPSGKFDIVASSGRGLLVSGNAGTSTAQASFSGSSNTMLLRAGNSDGNNYTFSVQKNDSSSVLFIGNDGFIGVGNTTPSYGLDVAVSARMDHSLVVGGTGLTASVDGESVKLVGASSSYIGLYPDSPSLRKGYFGYDEGVLKFDSESSSRHFNFAGGYVGLKTLTPNYDLTINAGSTDSSLGAGSHHAFGIVGSTDQETLLMGYDAMVDAGYFNVSNVDGAVPLLLQTLGGSVGIGSNSPLGRLDVRKGTASSSGWEAASFGAETSANDLVVVGNYNNRAVIAGKNATMSGDANLVLAPSGGNVGVGAMSPAYKLDIDGDVNLTGTLYQGGNAVALSSFYESGGNVYLNSGNLGIGNSSPSYDIDVAGDINYTGNLYKNGTLVSAGSGLWTANGGDIYFSGGNVGIGTTSPGAPLHIEKGSDGSTRAILAVASDSDFKIRVVQQSSSNATGALQGNFGLYHGTGESFVLRFKRGGSGNDGSLSFYTNGADKFNFANNGDMSAGAYYTTSDDRLKIEETLIKNGLEMCMKLSPQFYTKKDTVESTNETLWKKESGFIAQEIYYDIPELRHIVMLGNDASPLESIKSSSDPSIDPDYSSWGTSAASVNYVEIIPYTVSAIQELSKNQTADNERILELEGDVAVLQTELSTARTELDAAKGQIASMQAQIDSILARLA